MKFGAGDQKSPLAGKSPYAVWHLARLQNGSKPVYDLELFSLRHFEGAASLPR
jgi:hypothetical protein